MRASVYAGLGDAIDCAVHLEERLEPDPRVRAALDDADARYRDLAASRVVRS